MLHDILKQNVERTAGFRMQNANNFEQLSISIWDKTKERISPTTLKRFWGYLRNEKVETRQHTLDLLAKYVGFRNYNAFCERRDDIDNVQSRISNNESIETKNLVRGDNIHITWMPDRSIIVKYLGDANFKVVESINSKLSVGDTFICNLFIQNEPLYLSNLIHEGSSPLTYIAGEKDGVNIRIIID